MQASNLSVLGQRIVNNINNVMTGEGAEAAAVAFAADTGEFGRILEGMMRGTGGVQAVIQPGGSMRDDEVVTAANEHGMAMVFTGMRHFRH